MKEGIKALCRSSATVGALCGGAVTASIAAFIAKKRNDSAKKDTTGDPYVQPMNTPSTTVEENPNPSLNEETAE